MLRHLWGGAQTWSESPCSIKSSFLGLNCILFTLHLYLIQWWKRFFVIDCGRAIITHLHFTVKFWGIDPKLCVMIVSHLAFWLIYFVCVVMRAGTARVETAVSGTDLIAWTVGTAARTETEGWTGREPRSLNAASAGRARTGHEPETCAVCPAWLTRGSAGAGIEPPAERQRVRRRLMTDFINPQGETTAL